MKILLALVLSLLVIKSCDGILAREEFPQFQSQFRFSSNKHRASSQSSSFWSSSRSGRSNKEKVENEEHKYNSPNAVVVGNNYDNFPPRGGEGSCDDSNLKFFAKVGTGAILQSSLLFLVLSLSVKLSDKFPSMPTIFNQSISGLVASMMIIFGSSFFGTIVDGGLSVATSQALNPTQVQGNPNWFANLEKPWWNPPGWVFPIMWLIVSKPTQLCAMSRILKYGVKKVVVENSSSVADGVSTSATTTAIPSLAIFIYTSHLALGDLWNKVFFGLQCIGRGTAVITLFLAFLFASTYLFYTIDNGAGYYMLPTCGWVLVATALQWSIYLNNNNIRKNKKK